MHTLNAMELKRMLDQHEDMVLVNVLDHQAFEKGHVPGSYNVPNSHPALVSEVEELAGGTDRQIVVYCSNSACHASPEAGRKLEGAGFTRVVHFAGGMEEWKQAGYDVEQGAPAHTG
jgi:rhodanese-related sulfurtransferase